MRIAFPLQLNTHGRVAEASEDDYWRQSIEEVLFTSPGERVNRPDFGCGILQSLFAPNSDETATMTQFLIQSALQKWLGTWLRVESVRVTADQEMLTVMVVFVPHGATTRRTEIFTGKVGT